MAGPIDDRPVLQFLVGERGQPRFAHVGRDADEGDCNGPGRKEETLGRKRNPDTEIARLHRIREAIATAVTR